MFNFENNEINIKDYLNQMYKNMDSFIDDIEEGWKELSNRLAAFGWFLGKYQDPSSLAKNLIKQELGELNVLDIHMCEYIEAHLKDIRDELLERFNNRANILRSAFKAHKSKEYALSIPVFLSQAEGICIEITGEKLFAQNKGKLKTANWIEANIKRGFMRGVLDPLCKPNPLTASKLERMKFPHIYNRHEIIHGIDTDYATKVNSLKAISLLGYIGEALYCVKQQKKLQ